MAGKISEDFVSNRVSTFTGAEVIALVNGGANAAGLASDLATYVASIIPPASGLVIRQRMFAKSSTTSLSMAHLAVGDVVVGDKVEVAWFDILLQQGSGGVWRVVTQRSSAITSGIGNMVNGGNLGWVLEGEWFRFALEPDAKNMIDIRRGGINLIGATGQHSALQAAFDASKASRYILTGRGEFYCTETVNATLVQCDFSNVLFRPHMNGLSRSAYSATGTPGGFTPFFLQEGTNVPVSISQGSPAVVTWTGHGKSVGDSVYFSSKGRLPEPMRGLVASGGTGVLTRYYVQAVVDANNFNISTTNGGAALNTISAQEEQAWAYLPGSAVSNVVTEYTINYDGRIECKAVLVRAGGNTGNSEYFFQRWWIHGDGNFDFTRESTVMPIRFEDNDSPLSDYEANIGYGFCAGIKGPAEKHHLHIRAYCMTHAVLTLVGGSADTLPIWIDATACQHWYTESQGSDTSTLPMLNCESSSDPKDGSPGCFIRNGKFTKLSGEIRASNNEWVVEVDTPNTGSGARSDGADTVYFGGLTIIHANSGGVKIDRARYVAGEVLFKNGENPGHDYPAPFSATSGSTTVNVHHPDHQLLTGHSVKFSVQGTNTTVGGRSLGAGPYTITVVDVDNYSITMASVALSTDVSVGTVKILYINRPAFSIGRCYNAGMFRGIAVASNNYRGLVVGVPFGDATPAKHTTKKAALGLYSKDCNLGTFDLDMGTGTPFANGVENTNSGAGYGFPLTLTSVELVKVKSGGAILSQNKGKIVVGPDVKAGSGGSNTGGPFVLRYPRTQVRYGASTIDGTVTIGTDYVEGYETLTPA